MSWLGKLFGKAADVSTVVKGARDGIDALFYTDEERAHDAQALAKAKLAIQEKAGDQLIAWMEASKPQNVARRGLAILFSRAFVGAVVVTGILYAIAPLMGNPALWRESAEGVHRIVSDLDMEMLIILSFYFAATHMGDTIKIAADGIRRRQAKANGK